MKQTDHPPLVRDVSDLGDAYPSESDTGLAARTAALREHGDFTLAYNAAVHPGLEYFAPGLGGAADGFLAYRTVGPYTFALGDPVAGPDVLPDLVRAFVGEKPQPIFVQATDRTARVLNELNFFVTDLGPDLRLDLPTYTLSGKPKEWLRYASNWCGRRDYVVKEEASEDDLSAAEVLEVSEAWRSTLPPGTREVIFMNRPLVATPEPGVRRFVLRDAEGTLQNYVFFDPLYRDGRTIGYVTCIKRRRPEAPSLGEAAVMKHAIEVFKAEGREELRLGLSPLAGEADGGKPTNPYRENKLLALAFRLGFQAGWINGRLYALANHAEYKRRFRGAEDRTYFASRKYFNTRPILALTRMMGVLGTGE
ncbi:phosphatidylglycerol lysyltransferase domain-containing protein [Alienimonas chondri]|uniref:Phosphatidylglycerol lysyltransferase C-terminal domain-containing protein n=1 Tax=Alienimonas chondri TaxID=2681879 RepID=A0ABX1VH28_9PLAN|nr:phosphatidylglycerol lysyltransferase domain-containing protein [Alienimonas chondri]NNJ26588.1 hypothetical protein [Alienimonas chondri]